MCSKKCDKPGIGSFHDPTRTSKAVMLDLLLGSLIRRTFSLFLRSKNLYCFSSFNGFMMGVLPQDEEEGLEFLSKSLC